MRRAFCGAVIALAVVATTALAGCAPEPAPTPTPTALTEEQAFAAAEETYRAYVDATNEVDLADPSTFEAVFALTTGQQNENDRASLSRYHAEGYRVSGVTLAPLIAPASYDGDTVALAVCLDVSDVEVTDASGESIVSEDRLDMQPITVKLTDVTHAPLISLISARSDGPSCD